MRCIGLTGQQFGRWLVLSRTENDSYGGARWLCECSCGNRKVITGSVLRRGSSKSCGCLRRELQVVDMLGQKIGRLTVLEECGRNDRREVLWRCLCSCGNTVIVSGNQLRLGTKSCGCLKDELHNFDLTGQWFGMWEVLGSAGKDEWGARQWLCRCECGEERNVTGSSLTCGKSISCGCTKLEKMHETRSLPEGEAAFNTLLRRYQKQAKDRGLVFGLAREQFRKLTKQNCFYCGTPPYQITVGDRGNYTYSGIDRRDNSMGYLPNNCISCCKVCNRAKQAMGYAEFIQWLNQVVRYRRDIDDVIS